MLLNLAMLTSLHGSDKTELLRSTFSKVRLCTVWWARLTDAAITQIRDYVALSFFRDHLLPPEDHLLARKILHPTFHVLWMNPTGRYDLDLSDPADQMVLERLYEHNRISRRLRQEQVRWWDQYASPGSLFC